MNLEEDVLKGSFKLKLCSLKNQQTIKGARVDII